MKQLHQLKSHIIMYVLQSHTHIHPFQWLIGSYILLLMLFKCSRVSDGSQWVESCEECNRHSSVLGLSTIYVPLRVPLWSSFSRM